MDYKKIYTSLLRIRLIEEAIAKRYTKQEMRCPVHLSIGQEAIAVGVCEHLSKQDYMMSTHRAHAHYLAKGGDLNKMIAELHGKKTGCTSGKGGSMHLLDLDVSMMGSTPIVGGSLPIATGLAFASKMKKDQKVTVIFFGEGMTEEGVFSECLNFAALHKLPILFVCENNLYSVYSPLEVRQPSNRDLGKISEGHGVKSSKGNGNDILEVLSIAKDAVNHCREKGPYLIELDTYRWREHCGPNYDNDIGYRSEEEFLAWKKKCPIETFEKYLESEELLNEEEKTKINDQIQEEISQAFEFSDQSPFPDIVELNDPVYAKGAI